MSRRRCGPLLAQVTFSVMRRLRRSDLLAAAGTALVISGGCRQADQALPFEPLEGQSASSTLGADGGVLALPPALSLRLPAGAVSQDVFFAVTPRIGSTFPASAGPVVPGTAFDIGPAGLDLALPARVDLALPEAWLQPDDRVRLAVATLRSDGSVSTSPGWYDATNGILSADLAVIGPIAAVISAAAIPVMRDPPLLGGGVFPIGPTISYAARCGPDTSSCASMAGVSVWASAEIIERFGSDLTLLLVELDLRLDLLSFDSGGLPISASLAVDLRGALRASIGMAVGGAEVTEIFVSGLGTTAVPTSVVVAGNELRLAQTSRRLNDRLGFAVDPSGGGQSVTLRVEHVVQMRNAGGSFGTGFLTFLVDLNR